MKGQDALATDKEREVAVKCLEELATLVNRCIIRRTSALLNKYLPVKFEMVLCVKLTDLQTKLYLDYIQSDSIKKTVNENLAEADEKRGGASLTALGSITTLKKLCNHPDLIFEKIRDRSEGFEKALDYFPPGYKTK